jgi:hypothetical protein
VLRQDKELLVFPLVSSIAMLLVLASFVAPIVASGWGRELVETREPTAAMAIWAFGLYFAQYTVMFFFNSALVGAALIRLRGGDPTVADGFKIAFARLPTILGYAAIAATVGMILRMIEERAGFIGQLVTGLIGAAWTIATFLAVPVLVAENIGPVDAVKKSATLLKETWGENLIGGAGIGLAFGLMIVLTLVLGFGLAAGAAAMSHSAIAFVTFAGITVVAIMGLALVQSALHGVYAAAVYCYAEDGKPAAGFDTALLENAFAPKRR